MKKSLKSREAAEEDVPKIINLIKETIVDVYGQILPEDILQPWVEGDQLSSDVNNSWQNMIVAAAARFKHDSKGH